MFTRNISRAEIVQVIMEAVLSQTDLENFNSSVQLAAIGVAFITVAGIVCSLLTLCSACCCNQKFGGYITKFFVTVSSMVYLTIAIIYLIVGSTMWLIPN